MWCPIIKCVLETPILMPRTSSQVLLIHALHDIFKTNRSNVYDMSRIIVNERFTNIINRIAMTLCQRPLCVVVQA